MGGGVWRHGGVLTHMHLHMHTHTHACVLNMMISCKWLPHCIFLGIWGFPMVSYVYVHVYTCMHMHVCMTPHTHPQTPHSNPPTPHPPGGTPGISKISITQDNSIMFEDLKLADSLTHGLVYGLVGGCVDGWVDGCHHVKSLNIE